MDRSFGLCRDSDGIVAVRVRGRFEIVSLSPSAMAHNVSFSLGEHVALVFPSPQVVGEDVLVNDIRTMLRGE